MHLSALLIHPVKSLRGCAVGSAAIDERGIVGDRRFMVTGPGGAFLTQRTLPRMALVATRLDDEHLTLHAAGHGSVRVRRARDPGADRIRVNVWQSEGLLAEDCGEEAAAWLSGFLAGLNDRLVESGAEAVPMDRFRPNLVIAGATPHAEDAWNRVRIGDIFFRSAGPCARCVVTTTDQETGERGPEPLRTLAGYRRDPAKPEDVNFGLNVIPETTGGTIRVGDPVTAYS